VLQAAGQVRPELVSQLAPVWEQWSVLKALLKALLVLLPELGQLALPDFRPVWPASLV